MNDRAEILIVDDDSGIRSVLTEALSEYSVFSASDGQEALDLLMEGLYPDAILLDVDMPKLNGYDVLRRLKEEKKTEKIPVLILTGKHASRDGEVRGLKLGASDFIKKPAPLPVIRSRVSNQVQLRKYQHRLEEMVMERTDEVLRTQREIIFSLSAAAEYKDDDTGNHIKRVSDLSRALACEVGLSEDTADILFFAAPMHDIGKIGIPDNILMKPGGLNEYEYTVIKRHPHIGAKILENSSCDLLSVAKRVALTHHERWDGSGYPQGLKGEDIPIEGRIVAVCDVYDALRSERPYKDPWPVERVREELSAQKGRHFDPVLIEAFLEIEKEFPWEEGKK